MIKQLLKKNKTILNATKQLYALIPQQLRLGNEFWKWWAFYEESESWSIKQLREYQLEQIQQLCSNLRESSNYYREVLPETISSLKEYSQVVPEMRRSVFKENFSAILNVNLKTMKVVSSKTSGTTGSALQFYHLKKDAAREWASICHQWKRVGYDPKTSKRARFSGLTSSKKGIDYFSHKNFVRFSILNRSIDAIREYGRVIEKEDLSFYHGYPSAISLLAKKIMDEKIRFPQPKAVLLASEMLYDWQLDLIHCAFPNAKIFAHYGCAERTVLGAWCEKNRAYHILPQYSFVEFDQNTKEIIGTNLYNTANGFLRYRMTDVASEVTETPCPICNRPYTPIIKQIVGRREDYLYSTEKGWIPPAIITYPLKSLTNITETQFVQNKADIIYVRYAVKQSPNEEKISQETNDIKLGIFKILGSSVQVKFERVSAIKRNKSGKFKWIISSLPQPGNE